MTTVELKTEYSTHNPDEAAVVAARGDYMEESLVGDEWRDAAMTGIKKADPDDPKRERMRKFIEQALQRGHFGPFEHPRAFFAVEGITRDQMAQVTRHRVGVSFDVQSMRYVDFSEGEAEIPETAVGKSKTLKDPDGNEFEHSAENIIRNDYDRSFEAYKELVNDCGMETEDARKVLPIGTKVNMTFSANLRALMHIFDLRVSGAAQHDTRGFTQQVMDATEEWAPISMSEYREHVKGRSLNSP
jgi:thymidylate synthase (FAD)